MSVQITINLPDEIYRRAERLARSIDRDVADVLADAVAASLTAFAHPPQESKPVSALTDEKVLGLAELQMDAEQDQRLSELLDKQQAGTLTEDEQPELLTLIQIYEQNLLRKSLALREAVQRGLREPLES